MIQDYKIDNSQEIFAFDNTDDFIDEKIKKIN